MNIVYEPKFINKFNDIWSFIALDSKNRADNFKSEIKLKIENLENMPFRCRKSIYFENDNIRDLIFKGYTMPYKIDKKEETITILGINKYMKS